MREVDLLRFQLAELEAAELRDADEDECLRVEEERLGDADAARAAAAAGHEALTGDGGAADDLATALAAISGRPSLAPLAERFHAIQADLADAATELRSVGEALEADPERLAALRARRQLLRELRRKYGESLAEVLDFERSAQARLEEVESHGEKVAQLEARRGQVEVAIDRAAARVADERRRAAPRLAAAIESNLRELALPRAAVEVVVEGEPPADDVAFLLATNAGAPPLPLAKIASGGELARAMLAARLVLSDAPPVLVFDEVDAGIGGTAAVAVGRNLASLASSHQVLVVTHLPQVAAFADAQVVVDKREEGGRTIATARSLDDAGRVVELSRMLSGQPESATARDHAEELLASSRAFVQKGARAPAERKGAPATQSEAESAERGR
jgi:DNA repair protein RecN (Recombination protein N)